jgi:hypothetical protein
MIKILLTILFSVSVSLHAYDCSQDEFFNLTKDWSNFLITRYIDKEFGKPICKINADIAKQFHESFDVCMTSLHEDYFKFISEISKGFYQKNKALDILNYLEVLANTDNCFLTEHYKSSPQYIEHTTAIADIETLKEACTDIYNTVNTSAGLSFEIPNYHEIYVRNQKNTLISTYGLTFEEIDKLDSSLLDLLFITHFNTLTVKEEIRGTYSLNENYKLPNNILKKLSSKKILKSFYDNNPIVKVDSKNKWLKKVNGIYDKYGVYLLGYNIVEMDVFINIFESNDFIKNSIKGMYFLNSETDTIAKPFLNAVLFTSPLGAKARENEVVIAHEIGHILDNTMMNHKSRYSFSSEWINYSWKIYSGNTFLPSISVSCSGITFEEVDFNETEVLNTATSEISSGQYPSYYSFVSPGEHFAECVAQCATGGIGDGKLDANIRSFIETNFKDKLGISIKCLGI